MKKEQPNTKNLLSASGHRPSAGLIDTHAHLTFPEFDSDRGEVLLRAREAGVECMIVIGAGVGMEGNERALELAKTDERLFAAVGVHPHDAEVVGNDFIARLEELAAGEKAVAIGEIGLDYHRKLSSADSQKKIFIEQLKLANRLGKPVIIHDRDAHDDVWKIVEDEMPANGCVFHCFSGDIAFAKRAVKAGFYISVPGVVTFHNARPLREVVAEIPLERIVLETDCPYLAPEPYRGKRNEPAYLTQVAKKIAEIKTLSAEDVARVTLLNAKRLFKLPGGELEPHIAYRIRNSLYLNITNRCNLACRFCPKFIDYEVKGYYLKLEHEPDVEEIFQAMGQPESYDEVVFCGYGEPTTRLEVLKVIAKRMKEKGVKRVRLNTDGLANLVYGRNVLPELAGLVDVVSVSINAPDAATYFKTCPSRFGETAYDEACKFIVEAKKHIPEVVATVVALPGLDVEACRRKAMELGVFLRIRDYMNVG